MLYQVASAYNENKNITSATEVVAQPTAILEPTVSDPIAAPADVVLGPEQAAQLAAQVVGNTNLLSAESSTFNGMDAYMITFTNKDVVYVGLDGQILGVQVAPVVVNVAPPKKNKNNGEHASNNSSGASAGGESHEDHDDHEEHDD
jgi:hypothetical protein